MAKKRGKLPSVRPADVIRMLLRNGFREVRSTKHRHFADEADPPHIVTVPYHTKSLKRGTLRSIIRQTGWAVEEFVKQL